MRCETVRKLLDAYAEGNLEGTKAELMAEHLSRCSNCLSQWQEIQKLHWLLSDAFADFHPMPSPNLEQHIGQAIAAQRSPMRRRVITFRSQAIFAVATFALIWTIATFLHQPSPSPPADVHEIETATKVTEAEKPMSLTWQLQKPEKRTETVTMTTIKKPNAKRRTISLQKENVKVSARRKFETPKVVAQTGEESEPREGEQMAAMRKPPTESLFEIATEPKTVLVRINRIVSHNPAEPVPEIFVYQPLNSPAIQEVTAPMLQGAIVQTFTVAEIPAPSPIRP